jgi:hypothetical protein
MNPDEFPMRDPAVISRQIGDEAVLVHPTQGVIRILNPVGARIWELADGRRTVAELAGQLAGEYDAPPDQVMADVRRFCDDLESRGVLMAGPTAGAGERE